MGWISLLKLAPEVGDGEGVAGTTVDVEVGDLEGLVGTTVDVDVGDEEGVTGTTVDVEVGDGEGLVVTPVAVQATTAANIHMINNIRKTEKNFNQLRGIIIKPPFI